MHFSENVPQPRSDLRFGSKADMCVALAYFRFGPMAYIQAQGELTHPNTPGGIRPMDVAGSVGHECFVSDLELNRPRPCFACTTL
jgi:hypothetical protein